MMTTQEPSDSSSGERLAPRGAGRRRRGRRSPSRRAAAPLRPEPKQPSRSASSARAPARSAGFGQTDGYVLDLARKALEKRPDDRRQDLRGARSSTATPSPIRRARASSRRALINSDEVDLMLAVSTPETINPVADACEAAGVPCLSTVMPWQAWYFGRGAKPGPALAVQMDLPFRLRGRRVLPDLRLAMAADRHQQEGRRSLSERRRRQRHPRPISRRCSTKPATRSSIPAPTRTARPTIRPRSPCSRKRSARSSTPSRSRPISPPSGGRPRSRATPDRSRSARWRRRACSPTASRRSAILATTSPAPPTGTRRSPTSPRLTGVSGDELADGYEKASGKQWTQQLGASLALARCRHRGPEGQRRSEERRPRSPRRSLRSIPSTIAGKVDFTAGPVPNVASGPIIGTQWVKAPEGLEVQARLCRHRERDGPERAGRRASSWPTTSDERRHRGSVLGALRHRQALRRARRARRRRFRDAAATRRSASSGPTARAKPPCSACSSGAHAPSSRQGPLPRRRRDHAARPGARRRLGLVRTHQVPRPFSGMTVFENAFVAATQRRRLRARPRL